MLRIAWICLLCSWSVGGFLRAQEADPAHDVNVANKLQTRAAEYKKPAIIRFYGPIDGRRGQFFRNRLARAKSYGADLVIVEIDSPGGLVTESLNIAEALRDTDWAYTIAYIPREAISGGALMSLGCDEIVMGNQARFGDVGPIELNPELLMFQYVPEKALSFLARQAQDLAMAKGRPKELAEALVDKDVMVFRLDAANGKPQFRTARLQNENQTVAEAARDQGIDTRQWSLVEESGPKRFLTINGPRAVDLTMANFTADDRGQIVRELNIKGQFREYRYTFTDDVVYTLNSAWITGLLILLGLIALYFELSAPGIGAGGLIAGLCAILFFWSRFMGGTSGWLEVILFVAGLVFLLMEVFVIPGWGIAGFTGLLLLFVSVVMASQNFVIPSSTTQWNQFLTTLLVILCSAVTFVIGAAFISKRLGSIPIFGRLALDPPLPGPVVTVDKTTGKPLPQLHPNVSVGDWGIAESPLRPAGRAAINGLSIDVVSDGSFIEPGDQVRIVEIGGNRIVVAEIENTDETVWKKNTPDA